MAFYENNRLKNKWYWRDNFNANTVYYASMDVVQNFKVSEGGHWVSGNVMPNFTSAVYVPTSFEECESYARWEKGYHAGSHREELKEEDPHRICSSGDVRFQCSCNTGQNNKACHHAAALLLQWEKIRGEFEFYETEEEKARREEKERAEREQQRLLEIRRQKEEEGLWVKDFYKDRMPAADRNARFNPALFIHGATTNRYETESAWENQANANAAVTSLETFFGEDGKQRLFVRGEACGQQLSFKTNGDGFEELSCSCGQSWGRIDSYWNSRPAKFCSHALLFFEEAWRRIVSEKPGDETDKAANTLLSLLAEDFSVTESPAEEEAVAKKASVILTPKITTSTGYDRKGRFYVSFQIGLPEGRQYMLKKLGQLAKAVEQEEVFEVSRKLSLDFSRFSFDEASESLFNLIADRVHDVDLFNKTISDGYGYRYNSLYVGEHIPLEGKIMDSFYDAVEGREILCLSTNAYTPVPLRVGPCKVRAEITLRAKRGKYKALLGIELSGTIPKLLEGRKYRYILDGEQFGRVSPETNMGVLTPFQKIADENGNFSCVIGLKKFPEFYYRVLPDLRNSDFIVLHDETGDLKLDFLPPEGVYVFYIDLSGDRIVCRSEVNYGKGPLPLGFDSIEPEVLRDIDQEKRVEKAICQFFPEKDPERRLFLCPDSDEKLVTILQEGVRFLEKYGEVRGSEAFRRIRVTPAPKPRFSVTIEGGMLELSVMTKDLSQEELLELLQSHHLKKRWHRLRSGDFIDLESTPVLDELDLLANRMDISLEEMVSKGVSVPKYRALYVDKLLEDHDEIATARDKNFKSLVRSFHTIQDSDFEVTESLRDIVRPYQLYGFRWLSTLSAAGFGGILADEMGLGKTLQTLSYLVDRKEAGETRPSLVICPASLVYNWKEECEKFAGGLSVELMVGNLAARKEILSGMAAAPADIYVTSYDLLKRDITLYKNIEFSCIILDEAQYIKNRNTAVSKSVRILRAEHRFALTGTPIENRLSELWSIFDFLMPGFLYNQREFAGRFESPIMKGKDPEATEKLSRMTSPFILRRKKADVLKDLPDKLEEVQSCQMQEDQRRLYDAQVVHMRQMLSSYDGSGEDKIRVLAEITRLRQICCDPSLVFENYHGSSAKREATMELVERAMDGGHRMLLFSQFTTMLDLLAQDLKSRNISYYMLTGSTPKAERLRLVNEFNNGDVPVFLISLKAGGTGLNLVGADVVIHYDPWWNLAVQNQATDRAHRIGQTRQVTVMKIIALDSIEERILALQEAKREMADAIISGEGTSLASMTREELLELLG